VELGYILGPKQLLLYPLSPNFVHPEGGLEIDAVRRSIPLAWAIEGTFEMLA
jgi:hypothetical protein